MAISKTYLGGDLSSVSSFLDSTDLFSSVEFANGTITCKNNDDTTVLTITKPDDYTWTFTVSLAGSHTWEKTYSSHGLNYGYKCGNGVFLVLNYSSQDNKYSIIITKNNNSNVSFVFPDSFDYRNKVYCLTYTDAYPVTYYNVACSVAGQTVLSPFITNAGDNESSYMPYAFYIPFGEYVGRGYAKFTMNGKMYMTDGYWAVRDSDT